MIILAIRYGVNMAVAGASWTGLLVFLLPPIMTGRLGVPTVAYADFFTVNLNILFLGAVSLLTGRAISDLYAEITERKQTEQALHKSEEQLRLALESARMGIWNWDILSGAVTWAQRVEAIFGLAPGEFSGTYKAYLALVYPPERAMVEQNIAETLAGIKTDYHIEHQIVWPDETLHWLEAKGRVYRNEAGQPVQMTGTVADITVRKQAEEALSRYTARLEVLHKIDQAILAADSPQEIAQTALRYLRQLVPCQRAGLTLLDFETNEVVLLSVEVENETRLKAGGRQPFEKYQHIIDELWQGRVFIHSDVRSLPNGDIYFEEGIRTALSVPLIVNEALIGVVSLWAGHADAFSEEEVSIAREVADQLAIAIQNARLYAKTEQHAAHLAVLHKLDQAITASLDMDDVHRAFAQHTARLLSWDHMSINLVDGDQIRSVFSDNKEPLTLLKTTLPLKTLTGTQWVIEQGRPLLSGDLSTDEHFPSNQPAIELGLRSVMILPLRSKGQNIGAWFLGHRQINSYQSADLSLAQTIADQLAIAVENAHLFEQVQGYAAELEQRVADRTRELTALYDVTAVASESLDLSTTLKRLLEQVMEAMRGQAGTIHLLDESGEALRLAVYQGLSADLAAQLETRSTNGSLSGWVIKHGAPVIVPDLTVEPRTAQTGQSTFQAYVGVPMRARGQVLGVLSVARAREQPHFNVEEVALLTTIADQVAVVVESARLRQLAEQSAIMEERARLARDLHDSVTQLLYSVNLFATVGRRAYDLGDMAQVNNCLAELGPIAQQALKEMRLLVYELRPLALAQEGLVGVLRQRLDAVERRAGVQTQLHVADLPDLSRQMEEALYHIAQEALNNALKHAAATAVTVSIEAVAGRIQLVITDNGLGFDLQATQDKGGLGLTSIRERVTKLDGTLSILSTPGEGTTVQVALEV